MLYQIRFLDKKKKELSHHNPTF